VACQPLKPQASVLVKRFSPLQDKVSCVCIRVFNYRVRALVCVCACVPWLTVRRGPALADRLSPLQDLLARARTAGDSLSSWATPWMYSDTRPTKSCESGLRAWAGVSQEHKCRGLSACLVCLQKKPCSACKRTLASGVSAA